MSLENRASHLFQAVRAEDVLKGQNPPFTLFATFRDQTTGDGVGVTVTDHRGEEKVRRSGYAETGSELEKTWTALLEAFGEPALEQVQPLGHYVDPQTGVVEVRSWDGEVVSAHGTGLPEAATILLAAHVVKGK